MADDRKDFWLCKRCADAIGADMGPDWDQGDYVLLGGHSGIASSIYDPLHNDFQAMALVKKFGLTLDPQEDEPPFTWRVVVAKDGDWDNQITGQGRDLNRAIVECVAAIDSSAAPK